MCSFIERLIYEAWLIWYILEATINRETNANLVTYKLVEFEENPVEEITGWSRHVNGWTWKH